MLKTKIAIFSHEGQDLIVVPLDSSFNDRMQSQRTKAMHALQHAAKSVGLTAPVALVWRAGSKQYFMAPEQWHPFLKNLKWSTIISKLCAVLTCPVEPEQPAAAGSNFKTQPELEPPTLGSNAHTLRTISTLDSARNCVTASH